MDRRPANVWTLKNWSIVDDKYLRQNHVDDFMRQVVAFFVFVQRMLRQFADTFQKTVFMVTRTGEWKKDVMFVPVQKSGPYKLNTSFKVE